MADQADNNNRKKAFLNDHQLKELIRTEEEKKERWIRKWGFLDRMAEEDIYRAEAVKLGLHPDFLENRRKRMQHETDLMKLNPSPPAPRTMSQFVGWRSRPEHSLEICGPLYVSPKVELRRHEQPQNYSTIFLG